MYRGSKILVDNLPPRETSLEPAESTQNRATKLSRMASLGSLTRKSKSKLEMEGIGLEDEQSTEENIHVQTKATSPPLVPDKELPVPLPYRLTFKSRTVGSGFALSSMARYVKVKYILGYNAQNIEISVYSDSSGARRMFVDMVEVARESCMHGDWMFTHFVPLQTKSVDMSTRQGVAIKAVVHKDQKVALFADGFPVQKLRRSSPHAIGSPPPDLALRISIG